MQRAKTDNHARESSKNWKAEEGDKEDRTEEIPYPPPSACRDILM
jgi:hypothetical protein